MSNDERSRASVAMDAYASGDESAFSIVYDELAPRLCAYTRRLTRSESVAQDIVQQAFLQMHQARSRFASGSRVEPWAFAIARRLTIDRVRKRRPEVGWATNDQELAGNDPDPEGDAAAAQLTAALHEELENVPEKFREAFILVRIEGLSTSDAAEILGTTAIAVKLRAHRAGLMLRPRLERFRVKAATR